MRRVYRNVIVWDSERTAAEHCDVVTEDGIIKSILPVGSIQYGASTVEGNGRTALIPGFVNAHGHVAMSPLRGIGEDLPLMEWLGKIWPIEDRLNGEIVKSAALVSILEMLSTGTVVFADMYFFMDKVAEAALSTGMKCALSRGIVGGDSFESKLAENLSLARDYNGERGLVTVQLGPHAPYTVPYDQMKKIVDAALDKDLAVQLHWLETESEWERCGYKDKMTPEEYLTNTGMDKVKHLILSHCVWNDTAVNSYYRRDNITFAHNPKSNLKLGSGIAPIASYLEDGISVALGTDGPSSNNRLDMWDEMTFAALLQKGATNNPTKVKATEAFRMATVAGARALGFEKTGLIKEGYNADFILVDLDKPNYMGWDCDNLPGYIVYSGSSSDIKATVVAGNVLYNSGEFTTIDKIKVMREAKLYRDSLLKEN